MASILGIDAAWTGKEPSGVALLNQVGSNWVCKAIMPSYLSFLNMADGQDAEWVTEKPKGSIPQPEKLLDVSQKLIGGKVDLICIDMPLAKTAITGRRVADQMISKVFGSKGCASHSPNIERPGRISDSLRTSFERAGYPLATTETSVGKVPYLIEVYPHPALLILLQVDYRVECKVSKANKYWPDSSREERIENLLDSFKRILTCLRQHIASIPLNLPHPGEVGSIATLKRYEDALDALVSAWVGMQYLSRKIKPYGDQDAAIWVPKP